MSKVLPNTIHKFTCELYIILYQHAFNTRVVSIDDVTSTLEHDKLYANEVCISAVGFASLNVTRTVLEIYKQLFGGR